MCPVGSVDPGDIVLQVFRIIPNSGEIIKCLKGNWMGSPFGSFGVHHYFLLSNILKVWLEYTVIDILTLFGRVYGEITCFFS